MVAFVGTIIVASLAFGMELVVPTTTIASLGLGFVAMPFVTTSTVVVPVKPLAKASEETAKLSCVETS